MEIKKTGILGLGAVGAAVAVKLYNNDPDSVVIIVDEPRKERYEEDGFYINDKRYDFTYVLPSDAIPLDFIVVALKYGALHEAMGYLENFIIEDTILMSLMNGITTEDELAERYGAKHMVYSFSVSISSVRVKNRISLAEFGKIHFNVKDSNTADWRTQAVKALFDKIQFPYVIEEDMMHAYWWKFMINVGANQVSALMDWDYRQMKEEYHSKMLDLAMMEVITLSQAAGTGLEKEPALGQWHEVLQNLANCGMTSMVQDMRSKRKTEVDIFSGAVIRLGKEYDIPTPVNEFLYYGIKDKEAKFV